MGVVKSIKHLMTSLNWRTQLIFFFVLNSQMSYGQTKTDIKLLNDFVDTTLISEKWDTLLMVNQSKFYEIRKERLEKNTRRGHWPIDSQKLSDFYHFNKSRK